VYERLLRHRRARALPLQVRLSTQRVSAYDFQVSATDLVPSAEEVDEAIRAVEAAYPRPDDVRRAIEGWRQPA
jgi:hypothetical protein